jgi:hypothetical protein
MDEYASELFDPEEEVPEHLKPTEGDSPVTNLPSPLVTEKDNPFAYSDDEAFEPKTPPPYVPGTPAFVPQYQPPASPTLDADRVRQIEVILGQWTGPGTLETMRRSPTGSGATGFRIILAALMTLNNFSPHEVDDPEAYEELQGYLLDYQTKIGFDQFYARTILENIVGADIVITERPTGSQVGFCRYIQGELKAAEEVAMALANYTTPLSKRDGAHAILLFATIHGRLLCPMYGLITAPDLPGGEMGGGLALLLAVRNSLFNYPSYPRKDGTLTTRAKEVFEGYINLNLPLDEKQLNWISGTHHVGGLGLATQVFFTLSYDLMNFWSWLSDVFFVDRWPRRDGDLGLVEITGLNQEGDTMVNKGFSEDDYLSTLQTWFFTPPFAHTKTLRTRVLDRLRNLPRNGPYETILGRLITAIEYPLTMEENWAAFREHLKANMQPAVRWEKFYEHMSGVVSAQDTAARLERALSAGWFQRLRRPDLIRLFYGCMKQLQYYTPPRKVMLERGRMGVDSIPRTVAEEQEFIQTEVLRPGSKWVWPSPTPELNQAALEALANVMNVNIEAYSMPTFAKGEDEFMEIEGEGEELAPDLPDF